jgi:hypothetical protein
LRAVPRAHARAQIDVERAMQKIFLAAPALLLAGGVLAQDALDPKAKVPPAQYRSAFEGYRPFAEQEPGDWRKANEAVSKAASKTGKQGDRK